MLYRSSFVERSRDRGVEASKNKVGVGSAACEREWLRFGFSQPQQRMKNAIGIVSVIVTTAWSFASWHRAEK